MGGSKLAFSLSRASLTGRETAVEGVVGVEGVEDMAAGRRGA